MKIKRKSRSNVFLDELDMMFLFHLEEQRRIKMNDVKELLGLTHKAFLIHRRRLELLNLISCEWMEGKKEKFIILKYKGSQLKQMFYDYFRCKAHVSLRGETIKGMGNIKLYGNETYALNGDII